MKRKSKDRIMQLSKKISFKLNSFFTVLLIIALVAPETFAQESAGSAGAFLRLGVGARALSMGGAFVAVANDPSATFWNPAGLYQIRNFQFEFMNMRMPLDRTMNFFSGVIPVKNIVTVGVSWIGLNVSNIEGRTGNTTQPEYVFSNTQNGFLISVGKSVNPSLALGGSFKFIRTSLDTDSATGFGFDGGILFRATNEVSVGVMVQDIGTDLRWNGGFTEGIPLTLKFGAAMKILNYGLIAADVHKTLHDSPEFHFGGELFIADSFPIRLGFNGRQISGGAGLVFPLAAHTLKLNYGYSNDRLVNDGVHRVSVILSLGTKARPNFSSKRSDKPIRNDELYETKFEVQVLVKARVLNVRSGPGTNYRKIAKVIQGQKFKAFESKGSWRKIKLKNDKVGWVHKNYVDVIY